MQTHAPILQRNPGGNSRRRDQVGGVQSPVSRKMSRHSGGGCCCCATFALALVALSGFGQLCIAVALVFLASGPSFLNPHGQCALGSSAQAESLCSTISTLSVISICSGLILSVSQGFTSVLCGMFCGGASFVEAFGRGLVAAAWLVASILTTIFGAKSGKKADDPAMCYVTLGLCWAMFVLSFAMALTAFVRSAANCCNPAYGQQSSLMCCAEILCLAWLVRWISGRPAPNQGYSTGYTLYTPVPGGPGHAPPDIIHSRQARQHQAAAAAQYHEHLMHAHVPVTVVHPVSEHSGSFVGQMNRGPGSASLPYAPPVYPSFQPTMASPFGQGVQALGVPMHPPAPQQQYPTIFQHSQQQPVASGSDYDKAEPSAPPMPGKR